MIVRRTSISADEAQVGDVLDTFQHGRITVADIKVDGQRHVTITTTRGRIWRTTRSQLVGRIEIR